MIKNAQANGGMLLDKREVRRRYGGISESTLGRWEEQGIIPRGVQIGGRKFWLEAAVEADITRRFDSRSGEARQ